MFVSSVLLCFVIKFLSKFSYACIVIETVIVGKENKEGLKTNYEHEYKHARLPYLFDPSALTIST